MRLIDADAFKKYIISSCEDMKHLFNDGGTIAKLITESFCKDIDEQPTIEPKRKKGHWIWETWDKYRCSECETKTSVDECMEEPMYKFCPYCGADMRGERDEQTD